MANVLDVAQYILDVNGEMTTMKLQKLVYYCQCWSLAWDEKPLFKEDFQAWANGPVCPQLYREHKGKFVIKTLGIKNYDFTDDETDTIDAVLNDLGNKEPRWLSELTHLENPWKEAREGYKAGEHCTNVIEKESMQIYYSGLI